MYSRRILAGLQAIDYLQLHSLHGPHLNKSRRLELRSLNPEGIVQYTEILGQFSDELDYLTIEQQLMEQCVAVNRSDDELDPDSGSDAVIPETAEN